MSYIDDMKEKDKDMAVPLHVMRAYWSGRVASLNLSLKFGH